jgi:hypothetical protein
MANGAILHLDDEVVAVHKHNFSTFHLNLHSGPAYRRGLFGLDLRTSRNRQRETERSQQQYVTD